ncbi:glycoside hydrolase family protein [Flavobacterium algicola]|uniref:hypothetical protein n=1 Tax=Flavobacterium algicola TaxID=556529 RepID=UPI001EFC3B38|nr:hypothetical protein [Flavobacterium algicola]MCG9793687.1 hypothetical protein [Flavobacterium algicola]
MKSTKQLIFIAVLFVTALCFSQDRLTDNEDRFYTNKIPNKEVEIIFTGKKDKTDSELLNAKINSLSKSGGGIIRIKKGNYTLSDIKLQSNIHIKIDAEVTIEPNLSGDTKKMSSVIFDVGNEFLVENVAITNTDENNENKNSWYRVNFPKGDYRMKLIEGSNVRNFKFSGAQIMDCFTPFSVIVLNLADSGDRNEIPFNGIVKNILLTNAHVGYGVIQIQVGKTILCKNLEGIGGVTLRVETGSGETGKLNEMTVDDIVGRNIRVRNGDSGFNCSPHRVDQGRFDVEGVVAINSTFAVQFAAGFLDKKSGGVDNIGTFDSRSYIGNITVTGGKGAQIKSKDFIYFDCAERKELELKCQNDDFESTSWRSVGVIRTNATLASGCKNGGDGGCYEVNVGKITKTNTDFLSPGNYTYKNMGISGCEKTKKLENSDCLERPKETKKMKK